MVGTGRKRSARIELGNPDHCTNGVRLVTMGWWVNHSKRRPVRIRISRLKGMDIIGDGERTRGDWQIRAGNLDGGKKVMSH
jgi:hypothetical protein